MKNNNPDKGLLLISLLMTVLATIIAGLILSADSKDPIKTVMFYVQDGFTVRPETPGGEVLENDQTTEPPFIIPDITPPETTGETPHPPEITSSPEITKEPEVTTRPDVTTKPPQTVTNPPETQPPQTRPPETKPPETKPPETQPPQTRPPEVTTKPPVSDEEYFSDVLFLGDSRTVGFALYAKIPGATYFARTSMNVSNVFADKVSETKDTSSYTLSKLLSERKFGKIYILLGINEIGYSYSWIINNYTKTIDYIKQYQPDAKIIIQSNMHVTKDKSDKNPNTFNNDRIDELNSRLAKLADNKKVFYLDFVKVFDDASGAMNPAYSGDGVHLYGKCYKEWRDWILENGKIY